MVRLAVEFLTIYHDLSMCCNRWYRHVKLESDLLAIIMKVVQRGHDRDMRASEY